jgi:hypothetical protein
MPSDEDWDVPDSWLNVETNLFYDLVDGDLDMLNDSYLQLQYDTALFADGLTPQEQHDAMEALSEYLWDEYGLDFADTFDWDDYRDWYDSQ